ncbi:MULTISPECIES: S8 family serine peptidase [unclassified Microbulbifer]|uniref:S8 family peptidase n=1 Tax=unclassified Microbulbifer TaxID=2619833 RepID=UPI0027E41C2D|nr:MULTISPECIES: S8 family serine peptidase [unclassified Microbulbifer]
MSERFIVLQSSSAVIPASASMGGVAIAHAPVETLSLTEVDLSKAEHASLRHDPRTRAIARAMPMKLIEPVESGAVADPQAGGETWGVRAVGAPESPFSGDGVTVAVLDTGIDPDHPAFQGVELVRRNFTDGSDDDQHGHGTHCAGTIFGRNVNGLRIGVAPGVRRALIGKVLGPGGGSSASIAHAIQWAIEEGAHVISMSLGIDFPGFVDELVHREGLDVNPATSIALEQYRANVNLFNELAGFVNSIGAFGHGSIIVAASGNESNRPQFEIAVAPPAAGTGIVAVGALQQGTDGLRVASFSNTEVDVSAPGVGVISARPGGGLVSMSGTSMATPHTAGVAALWAEKLKRQNGGIESGALLAQLVARADRAPLAEDAEEEDVGSGIVRAPLE